MRTQNKYEPNKCDNTNANARRKEQIEKGQLKEENGLVR